MSSLKCLTLLDARIGGVPSKRGFLVRAHSQAYTVGWYAMPCRGMGGAARLGMEALVIPAEILLFFCGGNFMIMNANP